jgi:hypothetical protein
MGMNVSRREVYVEPERERGAKLSALQMGRTRSIRVCGLNVQHSTEYTPIHYKFPVD